ncbi:RDD family protein [Streptomyces sp. NPDC059009]|uniref:RDD family protein n=1 Tax=Streptomyces sp. NPDC059009 TaxID=3346694 RepID=UPI0036BECB26
MSAPTPAPGEDRPREGYYPDPSIPGYVRYWNGGAWVPGTSRPAPSDGELLPPPPGASTSGPPAAEETGPHFFDEEPVARSTPDVAPESAPEAASAPESDAAAADARHGSKPEPASAWQADASRQSGLGREQEQQRVSWGAAPGQDPRVANAPQSTGPQPADPQPTGPKPAQALPAEPRSAPEADGPGTVAIRALRPGGNKQGGNKPGSAKPGEPGGSGGSAPAAGKPNAPAVPPVGEGTVTFRRPSGPVRPAQSTDAAAAAGGAEGTMAIRALRPKRSAAQQAPPQQPSVPQQPAAPEPVASPVTSGPGGGSPSWAQQVHQLAQPPAPQQQQPPQQQLAPGAQGDGQPVVPWKPVANDPFLAAAQAQASERPAGLGKRLVARLIDTVVLLAVTGAAAFPLATKATDHINDKIDAAKLSGEKSTVWLLDGTTAGYLGIVLGVLLVFGVLYEALPTAKWGRTLGKKLLGVRVRDLEEHEAPSFGAALRRWLVYSVPGVLVVGVVGVLWCVFDRPWRQCWHDKAARTFVAG